VFGPGKARHDDHTLAIYEAAGFSGARADQAAATVFTFVLGHALGAAADASLTRRLSRDGGNAEELIRDHVARATELAAQFPRLSARLGARPDDVAADYGAAPGEASNSACGPFSTAWRRPSPPHQARAMSQALSAALGQAFPAR
jgi:hypothetical protein